MTRMPVPMLALAAAACAFAADAASSQPRYDAAPQYGSSYPDDGNYGGYSEDDPRAPAAARQWWARERWEEQRQWARDREKQWYRERAGSEEGWAGDPDGY